MGRVYALRVGSHLHDLSPGQGEDVARIGIAGIFHGDGPSRAAQKAGYHIEGVLGPQGQDDLVRPGPHAPARQDSQAKLFDQGRIVAIDQIS